MLKYVFIGLGFLFLGIGIAGIYLPVLPTTPFLLLATGCFAKGSEKFHSWFISTNIYKKNIEPIREKRGLTMKKKIKILSMITLIIALSTCLVKSLHTRLCLVLVLIFHYVYFFAQIKTIKEKKNVEQKSFERDR